MPEYAGPGFQDFTRAEEAAARERRTREESAREAKAAATRRTAKAKTAEIHQQVRILDGLLTDSLSVSPLMFRQLKVTGQLPSFDPGHLETAQPEPRWQSFAPAEPAGWRRRSASAQARYRDLYWKAADAFEEAKRQHVVAEEKRLFDLAAVRARYEQKVNQVRAVWARRNAEVDACQAAMAQGDPEAVEEFVAQVLANEWYPDTFPSRYRVGYRPESRELAIEAEMPPPSVVPDVREYRYAPDHDRLQAVRRPSEEVDRRYRRVIACIALRSIHDVFRAAPPAVVASVLFNGRASGVDPATGKDARPHLVSVRAGRAGFMDLELSRVEPLICITKHLGARISLDPAGLEPVDPISPITPREGAALSDLKAAVRVRPAYGHIIRPRKEK